MRGKRALELSIGCVCDFLTDISNAHASELLAVGHDLPDATLAAIVTSFQSAKSFVELQLSSYLHYCQELPWSLVQLADWDVDRARRNGQLLLNKFDASVKSRELHHCITWEWLEPDSPLRAQLVQFLGGVPLDQLGLLRDRVAELLFIPVIERVQEADHSRVKKATTYKRVTGAYVSTILRSEECLQLVQNPDIQPRLSLSSCCSPSSSLLPVVLYLLSPSAVVSHSVW
jgi:hypothetical protein